MTSADEWSSPKHRGVLRAVSVICRWVVVGTATKNEGTQPARLSVCFTATVAEALPVVRLAYPLLKRGQSGRMQREQVGSNASSFGTPCLCA